MKQKPISLVFILMMLASLSLINASIENIGTVKQYDCITLPQTCNCTWNNITTIMFPDKTFVPIDGEMTRSGSYFNYTFCNTTMLGEYIVNGIGDIDGVSKPFNYWFEVTTTGNNKNNTIPLFLALGGFIVFIFAMFTRNLYIGFVSSTFFVVLGVYLMLFGLGTIADFYTQALSYFALGFGFLIMISAAYEAITDTGTTLWKKGGKDDEEDF